MWLLVTGIECFQEDSPDQSRILGKTGASLRSNSSPQQAWISLGSTDHFPRAVYSRLVRRDLSLRSHEARHSVYF